MRPLLRLLATNTLAAVGYGLLVYAGLAMTTFGAEVSPFWPAAGLALALCHRFGPTILPGIWVASTVLMVESGSSVQSSLFVAVANVALPAFGAALLRRLGVQRELERNADVLGLALACLIAPIPGALATAAYLGGPDEWWSLFRIWWASDGLGLLVVAPIALVAPWPLRLPAGKRLLEAVALALSFAALLFGTFFYEPSALWRAYASSFLPFPFLIWAAMRFGPFGAALASLATGFAGYLGTAEGHGPFAGQVVVQGEFGLGLFMTVGTLTSLLLASMDAERAKMAQRLAHSQRMASLGTLAAGAAHEINNPLAGVSSNLQFVADMLGQRAPDASLQGAIEDALEGSERIRTIVSDLAFFAREESGSRLPVRIEQAVEEAVRSVTVSLRQRAEVRIAHGPAPVILGDVGRLGQVVRGLLVNAAEALPADAAEGRIEVATGTTQQGWAFVEVRDNGTGIPPEVLPRIFEPFFTTRGVGKGTGLGLAVAHAIVTSHGGEMQVESSVGEGTTMRLLLPPHGARIGAAA